MRMGGSIFLISKMSPNYADGRYLAVALMTEFVDTDHLTADRATARQIATRWVSKLGKILVWGC